MAKINFQLHFYFVYFCGLLFPGRDFYKYLFNLNIMNSDIGNIKAVGCCGVKSEYQKNDNKYQHSCCKLDTYNWLEDIDDLLTDRRFDCVEIRFKNSRKEFFRVPEGLILHTNDIVAVEGSPGHDIGIVSLTGETARLQMIKKKKSPNSEDIKKIYRKARQGDVDKWLEARSLDKPTMVRTRQIVMELGLDMKINDVEYQGDKTKAIFYYTADDRVDFRRLIKILAEEFAIRIEMKQIGVRQESGKLGGIGPCGRELCCSSWLTSFKSVSTATARTQNLSLNPQKLAGQCGKLKCCLNFENEVYAEEIETFPDKDVRLKTRVGDAVFMKMDVMKGVMWYTYIDRPDKFIELDKETVREIIKMNRKNNFPESLESFTETDEEPAIKFDTIIGQDDLSRFDNPRPKHQGKKKNRKPGFNRPENQGERKETQPRPEGVQGGQNNPRPDVRPNNQNWNKNNSDRNQGGQTKNPRNDNRPRNNNQPRPENQDRNAPRPEGRNNGESQQGSNNNDRNRNNNRNRPHYKGNGNRPSNENRNQNNQPQKPAE